MLTTEKHLVKVHGKSPYICLGCDEFQADDEAFPWFLAVEDDETWNGVAFCTACAEKHASGLDLIESDIRPAYWGDAYEAWKLRKPGQRGAGTLATVA
jgi:hypothetical protein